MKKYVSPTISMRYLLNEDICTTSNTNEDDFIIEDDFESNYWGE